MSQRAPLPTSGALPPKLIEDIRLHTDAFFDESQWARELLRVVEDPNYEAHDMEQQDMTMMMMVLSQMEGFREQWHETTLSNREVIYAVGQLISANRQTREQAERATRSMIEGARAQHGGGAA